MGCESPAVRQQLEQEQTVLDRVLYGGLPGWLARALGALSSTIGRDIESEDQELLESAEQILDWISRQRAQVCDATHVPDAVAEALLRHHGSAEASIGAYLADSNAARAAVLPREPVSNSSPSWSSCGICFGALDGSGGLWQLLACGGRHRFCNECLGLYVQGRLADGDVLGLVCPEPSCKLPLSIGAIASIGGSERAERFRQLRAAQAVARAPNMSWCPQPGCGRAIARGKGLTVRCGCGLTFCSSCLLKDGHEPASCQQWESWRREFPAELSSLRRRLEDGRKAVRWAQRHAQLCPGCRAYVEKNGGCNHMICRCGTHFCSECGRRWELHSTQPGGLNFYHCRLPTPAPGGAGGAAQSVLAAEARGDISIDRFDGSARSRAGTLRWIEEACDLWNVLHPKPRERRDQASDEMSERPELPLFLVSAAHSILAARDTLRYAFVLLRATLGAQQTTGSLEVWLGELEGACGTLEAALGHTFTAASADGPNAVGELPAEPGDWPLLATVSEDLQGLAARLMVLDARLPDLVRLQEAVERLRRRILNGARSGRFAGPPPGVLGTLGQRLMARLGF